MTGPFPLALRALLALTALAGPYGASLAADDAPTALAISGVTVVDVRAGRLLPDQTVLVIGKRIAAVGASETTKVPPGARVVTAKHKYLIPGLWDMHVHSQSDRVDREVNLPLYVANGVTGVRHMFGEEDVLARRADAVAGRLLAPRMVVASPILDGPRPMWDGSLALGSAEDARRAVETVQKKGYDFLKVYSFLPRDVFFAITSEAKRRGMTVVGHVPIAVSADEASAAGLRSFEHLAGIALACSSKEQVLRAELVRAIAEVDSGFAAHMRIFDRSENEPVATVDERKCDTLLARLAERRTWQVPTLVVLRAAARITDPEFRSDPRLKYVPPGLREAWLEAAADAKTGLGFVPETTWRWYLHTIGAMRRLGVPLLAGTDALNPYVFHGFSLHDELALLVEAGLTPIEALRAATLNPAVYLGVTDTLGTIEPNKDADLVLLDANPFADIHNTQKISAVLLGGRYFDRSSLNALLAGAENAANR